MGFGNQISENGKEFPFPSLSFSLWAKAAGLLYSPPLPFPARPAPPFSVGPAQCRGPAVCPSLTSLSTADGRGPSVSGVFPNLRPHRTDAHAHAPALANRCSVPAPTISPRLSLSGRTALLSHFSPLSPSFRARAAPFEQPNRAAACSRMPPLSRSSSRAAPPP